MSLLAVWVMTDSSVKHVPVSLEVSPGHVALAAGDNIPLLLVDVSHLFQHFHLLLGLVFDLSNPSILFFSEHFLLLLELLFHEGIELLFIDLAVVVLVEISHDFFDHVLLWFVPI